MFAISTAMSVAGGLMNYQAQQAQAKAYEAQAKAEKKAAEMQGKVEQERMLKNLRSAEAAADRERKAARAQFVSRGFTSDSPSANLLIGELGKDLHYNIQSVGVQHLDRISTIRTTGAMNAFRSMNNARASSKAAGASLVGTLGSTMKSGYQYAKTFE